MKRHADPAQIVRQHVGWKTRLLLIQIDRDDVEIDRRMLAQKQQDIEQREGILAAGKTDHDLVAGPDHVEVGNRLADLATQALAQLVCLEGGFLRLAGGRRRVWSCVQ